MTEKITAIPIGQDPVGANLTTWFERYQQRQTIEAGNKEEKRVFELHHLKVQSRSGILLQEQFVAFAANFVRWTTLWFEVSEGKADTYSVEGDNAELRHYLDAWPVGHAVFLVAQMRCFVPLNSLSFASIDVSFSNNVSRITQPMYSNLSKPILFPLPI